MADIKFHGHSPDGNKVILDVNDGSVKQVAFVWVTRIPYKNKPYYVLRAIESWGKEINPGDEFVFGFEGNVDTITGTFTLVEDDAILDYVAAETVKLQSESKSKPKPSSGGGKKYSTIKQEKREAAHHKVTNYEPLNPGVGKPLAIFRNVFYIIGMIWSLVSGPFLTSMLFRITAGNQNGNVIAILTIYLWVFFLIGFVNLIAAFRDRNNIYETAHNAAMVIGFVTFNPFSILGGYLNYRYRVRCDKLLPSKK